MEGGLGLTCWAASPQLSGAVQLAQWSWVEERAKAKGVHHHEVGDNLEFSCWEAWMPPNTD